MVPSVDIQSAGIKRLTRNDYSWLEPGSRSHQAGINLPLKQFADVFPDLVGSTGSPRILFSAKWFSVDGRIISSCSHEVVWYESKRELRLLHLEKDIFRMVAKTGAMLAISRSEYELEIRAVPDSAEPILGLFNLTP